MAKYHYRRYLYGTNSRRNKCIEFQNGSCSVSTDICPGFEKCEFYKHLRLREHVEKNSNTSTITRSQNQFLLKKKNESANFKMNCIIEIMTKRERINAIVSKCNKDGYFKMNMLIKTLNCKINLHTLNVQKVYIGLDKNRYECILKKDMVQFIDSKDFVTANFEFTNIVPTNDSVTKSKTVYLGMDDFYGSVSIKKGKTVPCIMEIFSKKIKVEEIIYKINDYHHYSINITNPIQSKHISIDTVDIQHIFIGTDNFRYELIFDSDFSVLIEDNNKIIMNLTLTNAIYYPGNRFKNKNQISFFDDELSMICVKQCPSDL